MALIAILSITPISDRLPRHRPHIFSAACLVVITGLLVTTFASHPWPRYVGLLLVGFGLGPTVPICMTWTAEIFHRRHGEVGVAAATALVSGLGNLGSVATVRESYSVLRMSGELIWQPQTYALYTGYPADKKRGFGYRNSNVIMVGILGVSILSSGVMHAVLQADQRSGGESPAEVRDGGTSEGDDREEADHDDVVKV